MPLGQILSAGYLVDAAFAVILAVIPFLSVSVWNGFGTLFPCLGLWQNPTLFTRMARHVLASLATVVAAQ
jgi:hypothetical protein